MPIYAYRCEDCGHELDALQKISDAPLTECPECGASALKKQITAAAFRLKGAGWYETDFKKDGKKNLHETREQPAAKAGDGKAEKTDKADSPAKKEPGTQVEAAPKSEPKPKPKPKETT
ncbi:MAG: FmdB family zinc ribbon protein [Thiohalocapsa sp.]